MPIYRTLLNNVLELAGQDAGGTFETATKAAMNRIYRRILAEANTDTERREFSLTLAASTSQYGMPIGVRNVLNFEDGTNDRSLDVISAKEFDSLYPGDDTTGTPKRAYLLGRYGVEKQPASAGTISFVSGSGADNTSAHKVRIVGYVGTAWTTETVTLSGASASTTSNSYTTIERITKATDCAGDITVTDSSANTLAVIPTWSESPTYLWYEFNPTPSASATLTVRAIMRKPDLTNNEDWPEFEEDFHYLLEWGTLAEVLQLAGKGSMADRNRRNFEKDLPMLSGQQGPRSAQSRVFVDITTYPGPSLGRPRVPGVDI